MPYQHHIFISYRRNDETRRWIREHFVPLLQLHVGNELGQTPDVFVDDQLETGASWPARLAQALGGSRILVALWSRSYRFSDWCLIELTHMVERQRAAGLGTLAKPYGLVVPAFIHDGEDFLEQQELRDIQYFEIQNCFNTRMARNSERAEELEKKIKEKAPDIARCIEAAPPWDPAWAATAAGPLYQRLHQRAPPRQVEVPRFTAG